MLWQNSTTILGEFCCGRIPPQKGFNERSRGPPLKVLDKGTDGVSTLVREDLWGWAHLKLEQAARSHHLEVRHTHTQMG